MIRESEFRGSLHRENLTVFLLSPTGIVLMEILRRSAEPKAVSIEVDERGQPPDREYIQFRMAMEQSTQMAMHKLIRKIEFLSTEPVSASSQEIEPLEDDSDEALEAELSKNKK